MTTLLHRAAHRLIVHVACVLIGHERWIAPDGEWICMRCGHLHREKVPRFPALPLREWSELPRAGVWTGQRAPVDR